MKRVLITGGGGFIGTHLADRLRQDHRVVLLDSFRRNALAFAPWLADDKNIEVVSADIRDSAAVQKAVEGVDEVVHLAAIAGVSTYYSEPILTLETNILGTVNLLECTVKAGVKKLIHFSTSEVYGANALFVNESLPCSFGPLTDKRWVYATSKATGENFCLRYGEKHGFACVVVRPFNVYGPRQVGEGAISNFLSAAASKSPLKVYGDGSAIRSWCFVSDAVDAVCAILSNQSFTGILNIGNPREIETTLGLARRVALLEPGTKIEYESVERQEVQARVPNIDQARKILSWEPKVDLDTGLKQTYAWVKSEREKTAPSI